MTTRGRILLVSYHFPPSAAVGGLRATRFARLLPRFGWEPQVLTVCDAEREKAEGDDPTRLQGLEWLPVTRTHTLSFGPVALYRRLRPYLRPNGYEASQGPGRPGPPAADSRAPRESLGSRFKRYVASLVVLLPDEQKAWSLRAAFGAVRLVRRQRLDWVLTSGPPFSVHFIGLMTKMLTSAQWIADFRDPWIEMMPQRSRLIRSRPSDAIERWMEAQVIRRADRVLTTTKRLRESMVSRYPDLPAEKFVCVPNAIDTISPRAAHVERYDRITITYAGNLYFSRTPEPLFQACGELLRQGALRPDDLRIKLVGDCAQIGLVDTREVARRHGVESMVEIVDRVPRAESFEIMRRSHALLVLAPPSHVMMLPAKVFDYVEAGAPIIALSEPGATTDFIEELRCGSSFSPTDIEGLKRYIVELLADGGRRTVVTPPGALSRYEASHLVERLAGILADSAERPMTETV